MVMSALCHMSSSGIRTPCCHKNSPPCISYVIGLVVLMILSFVPTTAAYNRMSSIGAGGDPHTRRCEEISIPMCRGIGYNLTSMPNQFNHETQDEAGLEVHQFWPLVEINCSPDLKFFICSLYAPICVPNYDKPLPACRSVCERAKSGCAPLMKQYGFEWPERMNCSKLPTHATDDQLCMDRNKSDSNGGSSSTPKPARKQPPSAGDGKATNNGGNHQQNKHLATAIDEPAMPMDNDDFGPIWPIECKCDCRGSFVRVKTQAGLLSKKSMMSVGNVSSCANPCYSAFFSKQEQNFTTFWIGLWSILCCISTLMTVSTFLIDMDRFRYPERPIIFLSFCYLMISVGYIIRLVAGHEAVACDGQLVRSSTTDPAICTVCFLLIYFFTMSSSIWWVILAFTWFLSAGLKWSSEAIAKYAQYFHILAWALPSVKSVAILAMSAIDGDPVSGVCFVGNTDLGNLRGFVMAPLFIYLIIGSFFLLAGYVSMYRIRNVIKQQGHSKIDKLEKLMIRIGFFSALYVVPAGIVIACYFYEQFYRLHWEMSINCPCLEQASKPDFALFMLKYFMCLVVGITSGIWIWSHKTLDSWRRFYYRICCCCGSRHHVDPDHLYQPAEAIIVKKSHTDISSGYNIKYPLSHV